MQITLDPAIEQEVLQQARDAGQPDPAEYIAELVHREWKRKLAERLGIEWTPELAREMEEGARVNADRDLEIAREWGVLDTYPDAALNEVLANPARFDGADRAGDQSNTPCTNHRRRPVRGSSTRNSQ